MFISDDKKTMKAVLKIREKNGFQTQSHSLSTITWKYRVMAMRKMKKLKDEMMKPE